MQRNYANLMAFRIAANRKKPGNLALQEPQSKKEHRHHDHKPQPKEPIQPP
jgi:hypothetical protein